MSEPVRVLLVWAETPSRWVERELFLPIGASLADAIRAGGRDDVLMGAHPNHGLWGVWGRKQALSYRLRQDDRVELYQPLLVDPKHARRERFQTQGSRGAGLFAKRRVGAKAGY